MNLRAKSFVALVCLACAVAAVATASTPATPDQTSAIAAAMGLPANCTTASISSTDPTWAVGQDTNAAGCPNADGRVVLHQQSGTWKFVTAGSDFGFCPIKQVPAAISSEFHLCRKVHASDYVLGSANFNPGGSGFGTSKPRKIFNGGDPSGLVTSITWKHWGSSVASGRGKNWIFKPQGGYYAKQVTIELRAEKRGRCDNQPAYERLEAREPSKPGGKVGHWFLWAGSRTICGPVR